MQRTFDDEPDYFLHSAILRIHGIDLPLEEISHTLKVLPTHVHRRGERRRPGSAPFEDDAWHLASSLPREQEMTEHLRELWHVVQPSTDYLRALEARLDVFCGYRSNNGTGGFQVEPDALAIFTALDAPLSISVIVDTWLGDALSEPQKH